MSGSIRSRQWRMALSIVFGILIVATGATPALAASTPYNATFTESTTPRACPAGLPANAFCFTGTGTGPSTPPVPTDLMAKESFAGFVDQNKADPVTHCAPDFNVVRISTYAGTLFLTTQGHACPISQTQSIDNGTWRAVGGTGIFAGASGSGTVSTTAVFLPTGVITSVSTYNGTLNLRGED